MIKLMIFLLFDIFLQIICENNNWNMTTIVIVIIVLTSKGELQNVLANMWPPMNLEGWMWIA